MTSKIRKIIREITFYKKKKMGTKSLTFSKKNLSFFSNGAFLNFSENNRSENESKSKENLSLWGLKREEILKSEEIIYQAGLKSDEITFQAGVFIIHFFVKSIS